LNGVDAFRLKLTLTDDIIIGLHQY